MGNKNRFFPPPKPTPPMLAAQREIRRQLVGMNAEYELELDALVLWTLHTDYGFGMTRLRRAYESILRKRKEMHRFYSGESVEGDGKQGNVAIEYFACKKKLKDYGFDLDREYEELSSKYRVK